jgi:hypothetical protein
METMNYITVLDFETGEVCQYDTESCEEYLIDKGHNLNNCEWMCHKTNTIHHG